MMRLVFFGSGEFGLPTLRTLHERHDVAAVVSQPDRPAGRKRHLTPTPVAAWAQEHGLPILKPEDVNETPIIEQIAAFRPDASVVIAFGQKLSPELIASMGELAVNLHASLLPAYRGAAPIQRAVMDDQPTTGVSVIALAQRMDAGDIYAQASIDIDPLETAGELHDRLAALGPQAIASVLSDLQEGRLHSHHQNEAQATRAAKLSKAEGTVDFHQPAQAVRARVHGLTPWPGCRVQWISTTTGRAQPLILRRVQAHREMPSSAAPGTVLEDFRVAAAPGIIELLEVQAPGSKAMPVEIFARGHALTVGDRLESLV